MRRPSSKKEYRQRVCKGGPFAGQKAWFPVQNFGDELSLPIRVKSWSDEVGRYNLNTGQWVPNGQ